MDRRDFFKASLGTMALFSMGSPVLLEAETTTMKTQKISLRYKLYDLKLKHTWSIARGSRDISTIVLAEIECDGTTGIGEAALSTSSRYGETKETVIEFLKKVHFPENISLWEREKILEYIDKIAPGNYAAKASLDIALHDWVGKKLGIPLYRVWGLSKENAPITSFSIGLDTIENMLLKVREAEEYPLLKIKVGKANDKEIISSIRKATKKPIRVDANEAWKSKEEALEKILWMQDQGIEFVEQPMPVSQLEDTAWLRESVDIPIIADESVGRLQDIPKLQGAFDGINIKLMKCGGLHEALKMIYTARALNMKVMMGCMIESSVGISAAAHLSPLIDYADLDGNLLISNDPYESAKVIGGKLILNEMPGLGLTAKAL